MHLPGFAVLTRVVFETPTPEGDGYFCALAVPAPSAEAANQAALAFLKAPAQMATAEDTRALTPEEAEDLVGIRLLGQRIYFQKDGA